MATDMTTKVTTEDEVLELVTEANYLLMRANYGSARLKEHTGREDIKKAFTAAEEALFVLRGTLCIRF